MKKSTAKNCSQSEHIMVCPGCYKETCLCKDYFYCPTCHFTKAACICGDLRDNEWRSGDECEYFDESNQYDNNDDFHAEFNPNPVKDDYEEDEPSLHLDEKYDELF